MYVDSGTFWVIAIGLGIAIGVVYYLLNNQIKNNSQSIQTIMRILQEMANVIDQEFANVRNEGHRANAKIYNDMADALDDLTAKTAKKAKKR